MPNKSSDNYFKNINASYKKIALERIYKKAVLSDPMLSDEFKKPIMLRMTPNDKLENIVLNSIYFSL